jgi:hypothetical protein
MAFNVFGNATPATINGNDSDDYALGTVVRITEAVTITKARQYFSNPLPSGPVVWRVSDLSTHDILVSHTFTSPTSGWFEQTLASPLVITGARNVVVWSGTPDGYVFTNGFFTSAATVSGPLTAPKSSDDPEGIGNGRFGGSAGSYPAGTSGATAYFVDMVVELAPAEGSVSFDLNLTVAGVGESPAAVIPEGIAAFGLTFTVAGVGVSPAPPAAPVRGGWDSLGAIYRSNAEEAERERTKTIVECPVHLYPLEQGRREGTLHCKFGGDLWDVHGRPIYF